MKLNSEAMETNNLTLGTRMGKLIKNAEFNRFGLTFVILTVVGCLGGIAIGFGAINYTLSLIAVVLPSMLTLSLLIAVAPMRVILITTILAVTIDLLLIIYFLFN
jgi:hypothetical protein